MPIGTALTVPSKNGPWKGNRQPWHPRKKNVYDVKEATRTLVRATIKTYGKKQWNKWLRIAREAESR